MLPESPGIYQDEILAEVIGFLEACQDRLNDLIEAGSAGVLNESDMELCLKVYESVMKTLEAEKVNYLFFIYFLIIIIVIIVILIHFIVVIIIVILK